MNAIEKIEQLARENERLLLEIERLHEIIRKLQAQGNEG